MCIGELVVNPHQQHMVAFYWVIDWEGMVSVSSLVGLLEKHFFPKWLQVSPVSACGVWEDSWGDWGHKEKKLHWQAGHSAHPLLSICHRGPSTRPVSSPILRAARGWGWEAKTQRLHAGPCTAELTPFSPSNPASSPACRPGPR